MSIWRQNRFTYPGRPRHALGVWMPAHPLTAKAYVPTRKDRAKLAGKKTYFLAFGGQTGDVSILANQWVELRQTVQSDFICYAILASTTTSSQASPGGRMQILDISSQPGRGVKLSSTGVNNVNFGGSARHPFILRKPYTFKAGRQIVVKIQNLQSSTNNFQVVLLGVFDE